MMTVDASTCCSFIRYDLALTKTTKLTLVDAHELPCFIPRFYQSIGNPRINTILCHRNIKWTITDTIWMLFIPDSHLYLHFPSNSLLQQVLPVVFGNINNFVAIHSQ